MFSHREVNLALTSTFPSSLFLSTTLVFPSAAFRHFSLSLAFSASPWPFESPALPSPSLIHLQDLFNTLTVSAIPLSFPTWHPVCLHHKGLWVCFHCSSQSDI